MVTIGSYASAARTSIAAGSGGCAASASAANACRNWCGPTATIAADAGSRVPVDRDGDAVARGRDDLRPRAGPVEAAARGARSAPPPRGRSRRGRSPAARSRSRRRRANATRSTLAKTCADARRGRRVERRDAQRLPQEPRDARRQRRQHPRDGLARRAREAVALEPAEPREVGDALGQRQSARREQPDEQAQPSRRAARDHRQRVGLRRRERHHRQRSPDEQRARGGSRRARARPARASRA